VGACQSLKSLALFEGLTTTESSVFDRKLSEAKAAAGSVIDIGGSLLVVTRGELAVAVETANEPIQYATVGEGELVGELAFFEPNPVRLHVAAKTDTEYLSIDRRALKHCFRYSRTGAVKVMIAFARSLSQRIRSANDVLQKLVESEPSIAAAFHRPSQLDENDVQHVVNLAASRGFDAGEVIFQEGDMGRELYVIREGDVEIARSGASGAPMTLARLSAGDYFGEMAFVDEKPRSASAKALSPLQVCVLPSGTLDRAVELNVGMALYLTGVVCKIMARRLNATLKKLAS
jgi:CRP-like cAMP-binding protein